MNIICNYIFRLLGVLVLVHLADNAIADVNFQPIRWAETSSGPVNNVVFTLKWERTDEQSFDSRTFFELEEIRDDADNSAPSYEFQHTYYVSPREIYIEGSSGFPDQYHKVLKFYRKLRNRYDYKYRVRPCQRNEAFEVICGDWTSQITKDVAPSLFDGPDQNEDDMPWLGGSGRDPQTDALVGGSYRSVRGGRSGMTFHWANNLRRDENDPLFEDVYDLVIVWMTHQWDEGLQRFVPVWLYSQMTYKDGTQDQLQGPIYYLDYDGFYDEYEWVAAGYMDIDLVGDSYEDCDGDIVSSPIDQNMVVDVDWRTSLPGMYITEDAQGSIVIDRLVHLAHPNAASVEPRQGMGCTSMLTPHGTDVDGNPIDHFQGWYKEIGAVNEGYGIVSSIFNEMELIHFLFTNNSHEPIWASAQWEDIGDGNSQPAPIGSASNPEEFCAFTVFDAPPPTVTTDYRGTHINVGCNWPEGQDAPDPGEYNVKRYFEPLDEDTVGTKDRHLNITTNINLSGVPGTVDASLNIGTYPNVLDRHIKITHFHDIRTIIDNSQLETECVRPLGHPCEMSLMWFRDGYYPGAEVYKVRYDNSGNFGESNVESRSLVSGSPSTGPSVPNFPVQISVDGWYRFELRKPDDNPSDEILSVLLAESSEIEVIESSESPEPETPMPPANDPGFNNTEPGVLTESSKVGGAEGSFRVNETGAATYNYPIMTAPGSGGVEPQIALTYNSHDEEDFLGRGWSISGMSVITRCGKSLESGDAESSGVTLTGEDRFCLNGQRMILVSSSDPVDYGSDGSVYRLEVDNFTRITAHHLSSVQTGPAYFVVERKDGSISMLGWDGTSATSSSSRIDIPGESAVFAWPVSRFEDSAGNYMLYEYQQPGAAQSPAWIEWIPDRISYTGNSVAGTTPFAEIDFVYESGGLSSDYIRTNYIAGKTVKRTQRLEKIVSSNNGLVMRRYELGYSPLVRDNPTHSGYGTYGYVLETLEECWDEPDAGGETGCLPAIEFAWNKGEPRLHDVRSFADSSMISNFLAARPVDVNGDGFNDFVVFVGDGLNWSGFRVAINDGEGQFNLSPIQYTICEYEGVADAPWAVIDHDGDGYSSVIYPIETLSGSNCPIAEPGLYAHEWDQQGGNFGNRVRYAALPGTVYNENFEISVADWSGDGLPDIIMNGEENFAFESDAAWLYENESLTSSGLPFPTITSLQEQWSDWLPNCDPQNNECNCSDPNDTWEEKYHIELIDGGPIEFDGSGRVALPARYSVTFRCSAGPIELMTSDDDLNGNGSTVLGQHVEEGILQAAPQQNGSFELELKQEISLGVDDSLRPGDANGDGYTDLMILRDALYVGVNPPDIDIEFMINRGGIYEPPVYVKTATFENGVFARFIDYNLDGYLDIAVPSGVGTATNNPFWTFDLWEWDSSGGGYPGTGGGVSINASGLEEGDQVFTADINGDGFADFQQFSDKGDGWKIYTGNGRACQNSGASSCYNNGLLYAFGKLDAITDGLASTLSDGDPMTDIVYRPLTSRAVHTRDSNGPYTGWYRGSVVYDAVPSMYVVSRVKTRAPTGAVDQGYDPDAETAVDYYYTGAKVQGGGRGFLGFGQVGSFDPQSGMLTVTSYEQIFPRTGRPLSTESFYMGSGTDPWIYHGSGFSLTPLPDPVEHCPTQDCPNMAMNPIGAGILLGRSSNQWAEMISPTSNSDARHVYLQSSSEENWSAVTNTGGAVTGRTFTHMTDTQTLNIDDYGNPRLIEVTTYTDQSGTNWFSRQTTDNDYDNDTGNWHLGRLKCSKVTSNRSAVQGSVTRETGYLYDSTTGILESEIIEPEGFQLCDTFRPPESYKLKTDYGLDDFGNREFIEIHGEGLSQSRKTHQVFDSNGRYVQEVREFDDAAQEQTVQQVLSRDHFGNPLHVRDAQGVDTFNYYDHLGRDHYSYVETGSWSRVLYSETGGIQDECGQGAVVKEVSTSADGARSVICRDVLGREIRSISSGFDAGDNVVVDSGYDYASRVTLESQPHFDNASAPSWTWTYYDAVGRMNNVFLPDGREQIYEHLGLTTSIKLDPNSTDPNVSVQERQVDRNPLGDKIEVRALDDAATGQWATTTYVYDNLGQLTHVDGPLSGADDEIVIQYDVLGHKTYMDDPDKGVWTYKHNVLGELTCQINPQGDGVSISRDRRGRKVLREDLSSIDNLDNCAGTTEAATEWLYYTVTAPHRNFDNVHLETHDEYDSEIGNHYIEYEYIYDTFGRISTTHTDITEQLPGSKGETYSRSYTEITKYDHFGRVFQEFDASGGDRGVRYLYNGNGYLEALRETELGPFGTVYWEITEKNAYGKTTSAYMGNSVHVTANYEAATGRLLRLTHDAPSAADPLDIDLLWDELGRVDQRHNYGGSPGQGPWLKQEKYSYDNRNRLSAIDHRDDDTQSWEESQRLRYDVSGNILCKSGDGMPLDCTDGSDANYDYSGNNRPHAVSGIDTLGTHFTYEYDSRGNLLRERTGLQDKRTFQYTTYDKVAKVSTSSHDAVFQYSSDRSRVVRRDYESNSLEQRTHYVGSVEVVESYSFTTTREFRRYIGGVAITTWHEGSQTSETRYLHTDHQDSINAITDEAGQVMTWMSYDPWGKRRKADDWDVSWYRLVQPLPQAVADMLAITPRGFTGHEHVDFAGIIHMNGRIYDPHLARFMQADPIAEDPTTLNRYTYVHNSPLMYTDPSGYSGEQWFGAIAGIIIGVATGNYFVTAELITGSSTAIIATKAAIVGGFVGGAVSGAISTGTSEGAFLSAWSGSVSAFFGGAFSSLDFGTIMMARGVGGGITSFIQGGDFGHGFVSAGVTAIGAPALDTVSQPAGALLAGVLAGTASEITGGKFANGAILGAFSYIAGKSVSQHTSNAALSGSLNGKQGSLSVEERQNRFDQAKADLEERGLIPDGYKVRFINEFAAGKPDENGKVYGIKTKDTYMELLEFIGENNEYVSVAGYNAVGGNTATIYAQAANYVGTVSVYGLGNSKRYPTTYKFGADEATKFAIMHEIGHGHGGHRYQHKADEYALKKLGY